MEKFDLNTFRKLKGGTERVHDGKQITERTESENIFQERIGESNSPIRLSKQFDKQSLSLVSEGKFFRDFPIGVHKKFNEQGEVVGEIDHDDLFNISLEQVQAIILQLSGKDIMDVNEKINVSRSEQPHPLYSIRIAVNDSWEGNTRVIKINGVNGVVEMDQIIPYSK